MSEAKRSEQVVPRLEYITKRFSDSSLLTIEQANEIIAEYEGQGFVLTLRQLYYQFVARDLVPNTMRSYKRLGSLVNDARLAGLIDWYAIEDRTRNLRGNAHWNSPQDILRTCASQYRVNLWEGQDSYVEVWIEKDALVGVIERVCESLDVPYFSCRGYTSQSEMWGAAQRLVEKEEEGKETVIVHLGDHDPSGIDMSRDIEDRLELFGSTAQVQRVALNRDQIEEYGPPPNPAKTTDSRYAGYIAQHGTESWELDALDPTTLSGIAEEAVRSYIEPAAWEAANDQQERDRETLLQVAEDLGEHDSG